MFGKNYEEQFEKWLRTISEKLAGENGSPTELEKPKKDEQIRTDEFTKQVAAALRDEFVAEITLLELNHIKVNFSNNNVFILKVLKL